MNTFNLNAITYGDAIRLGSTEAPVKVVEYLNLRCPDAKYYFEEIVPLLDEYVIDGSVERIIKHWNKPKLWQGQFMDELVDYDNTDAYLLYEQIYREIDSWSKASDGLDEEEWLANEFASYARNYGLFFVNGTKERADRVFREAEAIGLEKIPTVFVGSQAFVESFDKEDFLATVKEAIQD